MEDGRWLGVETNGSDSLVVTYIFTSSLAFSLKYHTLFRSCLLLLSTVRCLYISITLLHSIHSRLACEYEGSTSKALKRYDAVDTMLEVGGEHEVGSRGALTMTKPCSHLAALRYLSNASLYNPWRWCCKIEDKSSGISKRLLHHTVLLGIIMIIHIVINNNNNTMLWLLFLMK